VTRRRAPGPPATGSPVRVVLVTGAAGGIGGATVERYAAGGWSVALVDLDGASVEIRAAELVAAGHPGLGVTGDVRVVADCDRAVAATIERFGRLDAVVNAAGIWREGRADQTSEADWDDVIDVNLKGTFFIARAAIPHLERTGGVILNLSSDAGIQGNAGSAVYGASKGGVSILTKALALELAPRGVRVNAVCPGDVMSPMLRFQADRYGGGDPQGYLDTLLRGYPQGERARFIRTDEVAELLWYLAQPAAEPITGALLSIDFGISAGLGPDVGTGAGGR
jgi:NAD(P)-dependent dehydrogenase (short-subunit alcohol dehydrogenase family)